MKRSFFIVLGFLLVVPFGAHADNYAINDSFSGATVDSALWHLPTFTGPTDGTFNGQTQMRVAQNAPLPSITNGAAAIVVDTYNPTGQSFYGTEIISNQSFALGQGVDIRVVAKMNSATPGTVGGIFLYQLKPGSNTLHDEIDFELLGSHPNEVQTNIYGNEPLGAGHPTSVPYPSGSITDYHTYEIKWRSAQVTFLVDGVVVRTVTSNIPTGPMALRINMYVPGSDWAYAYNPNLHYTLTPGSTYGMSVDSASVLQLGTTSTTLTVNGASSATVNAGDSVNYAWSATNATAANSTFTIDSPACGLGVGPYPWVANTLSGTLGSATSACQAGHTFTITYTATNAAGQKSSSVITVRVNGASAQPPVATLTANGGSSATVQVGDTVNYQWSSTNATAANSTFTIDSPACGLGVGPYPWVANTLSGSNANTPVALCQAGHTFTIRYTASNAAGQTSTSVATVRVAAPVPTIKITSVPARGSSGSAVGVVTGGVSSPSYYVAVYIKVGNGWWIKPFAATPYTVINASGVWSANITTGGTDASATEIRAYIIPPGVAAPAVLGDASLPASLNGLTFDRVMR